MDKQREILILLSKSDQMTLQEILDNVSFGYYCNGNKHIGNILSRMVENKKIVRVKKGVFKINENVKPILNQNKLF